LTASRKTAEFGKLLFPKLIYVGEHPKQDESRMYYLFLFFAVALVATVPIHFFSVEHTRLEKKYGKNRGRKIGNILSLISGWGFFAFWGGIWFSPQSRFTFPIFTDLVIAIPFFNFSLPIFHIIVFVPFFIAGGWLGIAGVKEITLKVAETHRAEKVVSSGIYSKVRHPQYLGGLLAHVGISFLFSAWLSLLSTPLIMLLVFLISKKEENELSKEFGNEYSSYANRVPMFIPKLYHENATSN
jgi:protein-S-isoprenylcysteine O-methyltransferase Ste14